MSDIADLIAAEVAGAEQADASTDSPLPSNVRVTRGHDRSKVLQVRLNEDEYRVLAKLANEKHIPASTLARAILVQAIGH